MADLTDRQWELDGRLTLGKGTTYIVGPPDIGETDDRGLMAPSPRADGQRWGRGYRGGRTITLDITVNTDSPAAATAAAGQLEAAWDAAEVRAQPEALSVLRYCWAGRTRRVYGRPGKIAPASTSLDWAGRIDYTAEFVTKDPYFYSDVEYSLSVPFVPNQLGGLTGPLTGPWTTTASGTASGQLDVAGECPAWLGWRPHGPISNPEIEVVGRWSATLAASLAHDMAVTVDPSPWVRSARGGDGSNFAGKLTPDSTRMSQMRVPPGGNQVLLRGVDATGTSYMDLFWRAVWASY